MARDQLVDNDESFWVSGLRSYGKAVYAFGTLPLLGYFVVCIKILGVSSSFPYSSVSGILEHTPWKEFFTDTKVRPATTPRKPFFTGLSDKMAKLSDPLSYFGASKCSKIAIQLTFLI